MALNTASINAAVQAVEPLVVVVARVLGLLLEVVAWTVGIWLVLKKL